MDTSTTTDSQPLACLPSGDAALNFVRNPTLKNTVSLLGTVALRSVLVAGGLAVAGARGEQLLKYTAGAVLGIETGVLIWAGYQVKQNG
jgi:hypothetical protein